MKLPVAFVAAILVWSASKYLPTYMIEMRKLELLEQKMQLDTAKQIALFKELKAQAQIRATPREEPASDNRFY